ncbi:hypothetical protein BGX26_012203, partial [Mortierella sp. AD094]
MPYAKVGSIEIAAAVTRVSGPATAMSNGIGLSNMDPLTASAYRRRSLCSIDQPGVVMSKLPQELEDTQHEFGSKLVVIM